MSIGDRPIHFQIFTILMTQITFILLWNIRSMMHGHRPEDTGIRKNGDTPCVYFQICPSLNGNNLKHP